MDGKLNSNPIRRVLLPASLIYLAVPILIFIIGWLKWYLAIPLGIVMLLSFWALMHDSGQGLDGIKEARNIPQIGWKHLVLVFLVSLILLSLSGIGGIGYQDTDWIKHNALLKELVARPWPVHLDVGGRDFTLVYYLAYYLPAALLGKLGGWTLANLTLFLWSLAGLTLAMLWFLALSHKARYCLIGVFVVFSGLDVVGEALTQVVIPALRPEYQVLLSWKHIEPWSIAWQYSANTTLLFWVPQQALAGWIATGVLLDEIFNPRVKNYSFFVIGLTLLWSAFVTLGLLPYGLAELTRRQGKIIQRVKAYLTLPNACGLVLGAIVGLYYASKFPAGQLLNQKIPSGFIFGFIPDAQARVISAFLLLIFMLLEFGLFSIAIWSGRKTWDLPTKAVFWTTFACLALIPFYRYGGVNDFVMRTSIPALFALAVLAGRALFPPIRQWMRIFLILLILIGSFTAGVEVRRHVLGMEEAGKIVNTPAMSEVWSLSDWGISTDKDTTIILQYVGSPQAAFFRWLAR